MATPKRRGRKRGVEKQTDAESIANEKDNKSTTTKDDEKEIVKVNKKDEEDDESLGNRYIYIYTNRKWNNIYALTIMFIV